MRSFFGKFRFPTTLGPSYGPMALISARTFYIHTPLVDRSLLHGKGFANGEIRRGDVLPLLDYPACAALRERGLFMAAA